MIEVTVNFPDGRKVSLSLKDTCEAILSDFLYKLVKLGPQPGIRVKSVEHERCCIPGCPACTMLNQSRT